MITVNIREEDEFIKLGQALKKAGVVGSGVDATESHCKEFSPYSGIDCRTPTR